MFSMYDYSNNVYIAIPFHLYIINIEYVSQKIHKTNYTLQKLPISKKRFLRLNCKYFHLFFFSKRKYFFKARNPSEKDCYRHFYNRLYILFFFSWTDSLFNKACLVIQIIVDFFSSFTFPLFCFIYVLVYEFQGQIFNILELVKMRELRVDMYNYLYSEWICLLKNKRLIFNCDCFSWNISKTFQTLLFLLNGYIIVFFNYGSIVNESGIIL